MAENTRRKLLSGEKVEVRSVEDGFQGSWHTGTVIGQEELVRVVQYDHLLSDEGSCNLTERIMVNPVVDGVVTREVEVLENYRGIIRPLPPSDVWRLTCLHYGKCVDMFHQDAWWEGVIFDHEDGCDHRRIFFPDLGDEMEAKIDMLRLSLDWDEFTADWKPRGNWLFLEVIEEIEKDWPLPVSLKQIWYDVRMKNGFEKLSEWTSSGWDIWRQLVKQVFIDNLGITLKHLFMELNSSWNSSRLGHPYLQFSEQVFDNLLKNEGLCHSSLIVVPTEATPQLGIEGIQPLYLNDESHLKAQEHSDQDPTNTLTGKQALSLSTPALPIVSHNPGEDLVIGSSTCHQSPDRSFKLGNMECKISKKKTRSQWQSSVPTIVSGPKFCPDAYDKYKEMRKSPKLHHRSTVISNARKHLLYLGWKVEHMYDNGTLRYRYSSPEGELFYSLCQVCRKFDRENQELGHGSQMRLNYDRNVPKSPPEETLSPSLAGNSQCSSKLSKLSNPSDEPPVIELEYCRNPTGEPPAIEPEYLNSSHEPPVVEPEYCPQAVTDYHSFCKEYLCNIRGRRPEQKLKALKAKKHLSAIGWSFYYHVRSVKKELRYRSPNGLVFCSLSRACSWCIKSGALIAGVLSPSVGRIGNANVIEDFDDHVPISKSCLSLPAAGSQGSLILKNGNSEKLPDESFNVSTSAGLVHKARISRKRGKRDKLHGNERSVLSKKEGKKPRGLMKIIGGIRADISTPERRLSKRIRDKIASSSQRAPRTVLSWLIDNDVVIPRSKVNYRGKNNNVLKEGRIYREGIKCSCCGEIYSLSRFEAHAGSTNRRPSANIFLENGLSLSECQLQFNRQKRSRYLSTESLERKGNRHNKTNDCICSICHYGGELLLCDQCPSAFHIHCLGLKGVPDGDWFCPSCCCQICRQGRLHGKIGEVADCPVHICGQCEHRYHVECLRNKGIENIDHPPKGYWFCQDTCKQIFYGLQRMMGKPIPWGTENRTWTLLKHMKSDPCDHIPSDDDCSMENFSKLNVALSVMHECFEPVKEPGTRRDLVEDVIFGRWSELNRLNFQGFYTVLLEKNDELISAATVRIFGKRVAEVPLVATRFQYRRLGMCRVLMNELEKNLKELGVERLVLPAVPSVLNTWTTSFGFSVVNELERLNFLDNIFLNFPGTVTCQKILTGNPLTTPSPSTGTLVTSYGQVDKNLNSDLDGNSTVSEVFQLGQVGETDTSEHGSTSAATGTSGADNENGNCSDELAIVVNVDESTLPMCSPLSTLISPDYIVDIPNGKQAEDINGGFKCYKRRKISHPTC